MIWFYWKFLFSYLKVPPGFKSFNPRSFVRSSDSVCSTSPPIFFAMDSVISLKNFKWHNSSQICSTFNLLNFRNFVHGGFRRRFLLNWCCLNLDCSRWLSWHLFQQGIQPFNCVRIFYRLFHLRLLVFGFFLVEFLVVAEPSHVDSGTESP